MNRSDRLNDLLDLLGESGAVDIETVTNRLRVSAATARRDLDILAEQQLLTRTRGGAVSNDSVAYELPLRYSAGANAAAKTAIAEAASAMVPPGASVGLCGGTTSTELARVLAARADIAAKTATLTVVTNAVNIAAQLALRSQIKVVVTGGATARRSYELVGPYADLVLRSLTLDYAFISVSGIEPHVGATVRSEDEAAVNTVMASRATRAVVVADSSKLGVRAFATIGTVFDTLITDAGILPETRRKLAGAGIDVVIASGR